MLLIVKERELLNQSEFEQKHLEDELTLLIAKIQREESRLYGGEIANPKELKSLQVEIKALNTTRESQEDELLAKIDQTDKIAGQLEKLKQAEIDFNKKAENLREKVLLVAEDINKAIVDKEKKKKNIVKEIDADLLGLYQKLRREKRGIAVAILSGLTCGGCYMEMPQIKNAEMRQAEIWRCPNCRRILIEL